MIISLILSSLNVTVLNGTLLSSIEISSVLICALETKPFLVSKKFTIAPAYNKGGYQVISKSDIKDIGK